jgi:hypothetical protein
VRFEVLLPLALALLGAETPSRFVAVDPQQPVDPRLVLQMQFDAFAMPDNPATSVNEAATLSVSVLATPRVILTLVYEKLADPGAWSYEARVPLLYTYGVPPEPGTDYVVLERGTLHFDPSGRLVGPDAVRLRFPPLVTGPPNYEMTWELRSPGGEAHVASVPESTALRGILYRIGGQLREFAW